MASPSPSPVQAIGVPSPPSDTFRESPRFSSSFQDSPHPQENSRTGLVTSLTSNGQRSYGTVKQNSCSSFRRSSTSVITYSPVEGDTLQGLALKFNVSVQDIERLNNVWSSDSLFCKPFIKIPISYHSNDSSYASTPSSSPRSRRRATSEDVNGRVSNGISVSPPDVSERLSMALDPEDEVRSKVRTRQKRRSDSVTAECGEDGVKNIKDILSCADVQLQASKEFAERLARRSSSKSLPKDAYHRTQDDNHLVPAPVPTVSNSVAGPDPRQEREPSPKRRLQLKRVDTAPEKLQESRDKLEANLFEL